MSISVRPALGSDVPLILAFVRELAAYEKLADEVVATEEALIVHLFGPRPAAEVLIGECNGEPMGFAVFFQTYSTFLARPGIHLEDLFVRPEGRKQGLGQQLLATIAHLALERGCGRLEWNVLAWNEPAKAFYRKLGAVPMDDWNLNRLVDEPLRALARTKHTH